MTEGGRLSINDIKECVRELEPNLSQNENTFKAMVVLLSLTQVAHTEEAICAFTGYSLKRGIVRKFLRNLERNGIIKDGIIYCSWDDPSEGTIAFALDSLVATGEVKRVS